MRPISRHQSALTAPLNKVLGTEANVRVLRVLTGTSTPVSPSKLAQQTGLTLPGVAKAVTALENTGLVEYVGAGTRRPVQLRSAHPLADSLRALFSAERSRYGAVLDGLKHAAQQITPPPRAVWVQGPVADLADRPGDTLIVGLLAGPRELDHAATSLAAAVEDLERDLDVSIEIRGRTAADLLSGTDEELTELRHVVPVLGPPPWALLSPELPGGAPSAARHTFSHADLDARARALATAIAERIRTDPSIVERARAHLTTRLASASPGEQRELREWERILGTMTLPRLRRFLVDDGERATRLRQTLPLLAVLTPAEREQLLAEHSGNQVASRT